jgi:hypothetical protein
MGVLAVQLHKLPETRDGKDHHSVIFWTDRYL